MTEGRKRFCKDCQYFYDDCRETVYRRTHCYFCRRRGIYFSRNCRVGEGNRILPQDLPCRFFKAARKSR